MEPQQNPEQNESLRQSKEKPPFKVPDGYFEALPNRVMDAVSQPSKPNWSQQLLGSWRWMAGGLAAASVAVLLWFVMPSAPENLEPLSNEEVFAALSQPGFGPGDELLYLEALPDEELAALFEDIPEEAVIEYLMEEEINLDLLLNEI